MQMVITKKKAFCKEILEYDGNEAVTCSGQYHWNQQGKKK